jgi:REP element-mobilizing transposase RayT
VGDHVRLLIGIKPVHAIADLVREANRVSSEWVKEAHRV